MPIGVISEEQFEVEFKQITRGRNKTTPPAIREFAAAECIAGATSKEVAEVLGISESSVNAYRKDSTSNAMELYNKKDDRLKKANDEVRGRIKDSALNKLFDAMAAITPEKLNSSKVNVASAVARDMSQIMKNVSDSDGGNSGPKQQVIIYAPRLKEEDDYKVIDISEREA